MSYKLEADEQERKVFIGGLNKTSTDEDELRTFFETYGSVIDATIMRDTDRQSRGFGFVLFEDAGSVDKVMAARKDGVDFVLNERSVQIKRALPKVPGAKAVAKRTDFRKIFVGGLASSMTEEELREYFEQYGRVLEIELLRDRETSRLRGFAFVTFEEEDSADKCIQRRSHEICKKMCEVKRAEQRSRDDGDRGGRPGRRPTGFDHRDSRQQAPPYGSSAPAEGGLRIEEINHLIQQAFLMGQQSLQSGAQPSSVAAALLNRASTSAAAPPVNNVLLQALMSQQQRAPAPAPAPVAPASANAGVMQLAQLLQDGGINASALATLLTGDSKPTDEQTPAGYTTAYPSVSSYDYTYTNKNPNYGTSNDDAKRRYNPY